MKTETRASLTVSLDIEIIRAIDEARSITGHTRSGMIAKVLKENLEKYAEK